MNAAQLKKQYSQVLSKYRRLGLKKTAPVLEQGMFLILQEGIPATRARATIEKMRRQFVDWNELRVSSIPEVVRALEPLKKDPQMVLKAQKLKEFTNQVFNTRHSLNLESLRTLTFEEQAKFFINLECLDAEILEAMVYSLAETTPSGAALSQFKAQMKQAGLLGDKYAHTMSTPPRAPAPKPKKVTNISKKRGGKKKAKKK